MILAYYILVYIIIVRSMTLAYYILVYG